MNRGYDLLIDVCGADHGGYVKRMKAAVSALSGCTVPLDVKLTQLVKLFKNGEPFKMSKRAGTFVTLRDVVDQVGTDPADDRTIQNITIIKNPSFWESSFLIFLVKNRPIKPRDATITKVFTNKCKAPSSYIIETIIGNKKEKLKNSTRMLNKFNIDLGFIS